MPTPSSEVSVYFDAPITHFKSSNMENKVTIDENQPIPRTESSGWLPATDLPPDHVDREEAAVAATEEGKSEETQKRPRKRSTLRKPPPALKEPADTTRPSSAADSVRRNGSIYASSTRSRRSLFTNRDDGLPVDGSTFINGAGTTGPGAEPEVDESIHERHALAERSLSTRQKRRIRNDEVKQSKQLVKVIRSESKIEKRALEVAIKELEELQIIQKSNVKREARIHSAHSASLAAFQKQEAIYLAARRKYESLQAQLAADAEALEVCRNAAREATDRLQAKSREVESLRQLRSVDERERAVKIATLKGRRASEGGGHWWSR